MPWDPFLYCSIQKWTMLDLRRFERFGLQDHWCNCRHVATQKQGGPEFQFSSGMIAWILLRPSHLVWPLQKRQRLKFEIICVTSLIAQNISPFGILIFKFSSRQMIWLRMSSVVFLSDLAESGSIAVVFMESGYFIRAARVWQPHLRHNHTWPRK